MGADERTNSGMTPAQLAWLADTRLMPALLQRLVPGAGGDARRNAASVLVAIARARLAAPLARAFLAPDFMQELLDCAFVPSVSVQVRVRPHLEVALFISHHLVPCMPWASNPSAHELLLTVWQGQQRMGLCGGRMDACVWKKEGSRREGYLRKGLYDCHRCWMC